MFYILSRFAALLASPVIYMMGLLVVAVLLYHQPQVRKVCLWGVLVLFLLFTNPYLYYRAETAWTKPYISSMKAGHTYEYAVVLGGFGGYNPTYQRIDLNESADRLTEAIMLYRQGRIRTIVIASDGTCNETVGDERVFRRQMNLLGVPDSALLIEGKARNTKENVTCTLELVPSLRRENFLLITSAVHMKRSLRCFREAGMHPDFYSTDIKYVVPTQWENWVPQMSVLNDWYHLGHEWIGWWAYTLF